MDWIYSGTQHTHTHAHLVFTYLLTFPRHTRGLYERLYARYSVARYTRPRRLGNNMQSGKQDGPYQSSHIGFRSYFDYKVAILF